MASTAERPRTVESGSRIPRFLRRLVRKAMRRIAVHGSVDVGIGTKIGWGATVGATHHLDIGRGVSIGPGSVVEVNGRIGDFVLIARNVCIIGRSDHDYHVPGTPVAYATWVGERMTTDKDLIDIGVDVWVGAASVILSGLRVGDAAIVAAGSVVVRDVPPGAIVGGNPAQFLRWRFQHVDELHQHLRDLAERWPTA